MMRSHTQAVVVAMCILLLAVSTADEQSFILKAQDPDSVAASGHVLGDVEVREAYVLAKKGELADVVIVVPDGSIASMPRTTTTICYATERSGDDSANVGYRAITLVTHEEDSSLGDVRTITRTRGYWGVDLEDMDGRRIRGLVVLCWEKRPLSRGGLLDPDKPGFEERLTEVRMIVVDTLTTDPLRVRDRIWFIDSESIEDEPLVYLRLAQNETSDPVWQERIATSIERLSGEVE